MYHVCDNKIIVIVDVMYIYTYMYVQNPGMDWFRWPVN